MLRVVKKLHLALTPGADPSPFTDHRAATEQGRLDRQHVEPGHVLARVNAAQVGISGFVGHRKILTGGGLAVQSEFGIARSIAIPIGDG